MGRVRYGQALHGPIEIQRNFSIAKSCLHPRRCIVPMQPEMEYTGKNPWTAHHSDHCAGRRTNSSYTLYEDSGEAVATSAESAPGPSSPQRKRATTSRSKSLPSQPLFRNSAQARLRSAPSGDWPPASVTVNGTTLTYNRHAAANGTVRRLALRRQLADHHYRHPTEVHNEAITIRVHRREARSTSAPNSMASPGLGAFPQRL